MKKTKFTVIILIFSILFLIGTVGIIGFMMQIDKQTENTTTCYSATVSNVQVTNTEKHLYVEIQLNEYNSNLQISTNISKNINIEDINGLKKGQKIFFRIENIKVDQINHVEFVDIVSLKTENKDIFTLDDYNKYMKQSAYPAKIAGIIVSLAFLSIAVCCVFSLKKKVGKSE